VHVCSAFDAAFAKLLRTLVNVFLRAAVSAEFQPCRVRYNSSYTSLVVSVFLENK